MIPSASIDVVVSNCVLNLVDPQSKSELFREMHRVLEAEEVERGTLFDHGRRRAASHVLCSRLRRMTIATGGN